MAGMQPGIAMAKTIKKVNYMQMKNLIRSLLVLGLLGGAMAPVWAKEKEDGEKAEAKEKAKNAKPAKKEAKMEVMARAELTQQKAANIALAKVPKGKIKQADLEMERGILMWSFEIAMPGTPLIAEVEVNAVTGEVVGLDIEAPAAEAKENDAKAVKGKEGKEGKAELKATKAKLVKAEGNKEVKGKVVKKDTEEKEDKADVKKGKGGEKEESKAGKGKKEEKEEEDEK